MSYFDKIKNVLLQIPLVTYNFFISLKLAVVTLLILSILKGAGTFVESFYNQEIANKLVYQSWFMTVTMILLACNLIMVLIDRWPWKKRQVGFVLAHVGILTLMLGFLFTKYLGLDASLRFQEGETTSSVNVSDMQLKVYSSYDGLKFTVLYEEDVDFYFKKINENNPHIVSVGREEFIINKYLPFAVSREVFKSVDKNGQAAVRFHLDGSRASFVKWLYLENKKPTVNLNLGPAVITLTKNKNYKAKQEKELVLLVQGNKIFYKAFGNKQQIQPGDMFPTGWMDFKFRLLEFISQSQREYIFEKKERTSDATLKAIQVKYGAKTVWLGQNSYVRFFKKDQVYAMAYVNKNYNLGFDLKLVDFKMTKYQGSEKAKSYESEVQVEGVTKTISMNEPLKHKSYTFYQSSFETSKQGDPTVSILSVNRDPGRGLKYLGSALIVLGVALLFIRRKMFRKQIL